MLMMLVALSQGDTLMNYAMRHTIDESRIFNQSAILRLVQLQRRANDVCELHIILDNSDYSIPLGLMPGPARLIYMILSNQYEREFQEHGIGKVELLLSTWNKSPYDESDYSNLNDTKLPLMQHRLMKYN